MFLGVLTWKILGKQDKESVASAALCPPLAVDFFFLLGHSFCFGVEQWQNKGPKLLPDNTHRTDYPWELETTNKDATTLIIGEERTMSRKPSRDASNHFSIAFQGSFRSPGGTLAEWQQWKGRGAFWVWGLANLIVAERWEDRPAPCPPHILLLPLEDAQGLLSSGCSFHALNEGLEALKKGQLPFTSEVILLSSSKARLKRLWLVRFFLNIVSL